MERGGEGEGLDRKVPRGKETMRVDTRPVRWKAAEN